MLLVCDFVYLCDVSDDRSADVFKTKLEAATQMKSVLESDPRPNCLVIDEIDGAPQVNVSLNHQKRGTCTTKHSGNILNYLCIFLLK